MSDSSRRTPPHGSKKVPSRPQSQTDTDADAQEDRDTEGYLARRARENAPAKDPAWEEDFTDQYEGEELAAWRDTRLERVRIQRLEKKHDELKKDTEKKYDELKGDVKEVRNDVKDVRDDVKILSAEVANATGKLEGQSGVLTEMLTLVKKSAEREHVTFTAKVEVDKAQELAKVEVSKAEELAAIEVTKEEKAAVIEVAKEEKTAAIVVAKEEQVDLVKAAHDRRKRNLAILGLVASGASVVELLHRLGVL